MEEDRTEQEVANILNLLKLWKTAALFLVIVKVQEL